MNARRRWFAAGIALTLLGLMVLQTLADEPKVTSVGQVGMIGGTIDGKGFGFLGICGMEFDDGQKANFGLYQAPGTKAQYTFLILYKDDPKAEPGMGQSNKATFEGPDTTGKMTGDFELQAHVRTHEFNLRLQLDRDAKTVKKDILTVDGKDYGPEGARVFLVDLTAAKPVMVPVKYSPTAVPDFADQKAWSKQILAAKQELVEKSPEAKKLFVDSNPK